MTVPPGLAVTTTLTVNPNGSWFGRLLKFGGPGGGSRPSKLRFVAGKRALRAAMSSWASVPSNGLVCV
jgi:hypothetical protein